MYLSTIIDLYDRHVVAYQISKFNDIPLVIDTLNKALEIEKDVHGLIIHSDQGFQYTSYEYKAICASKGITISMSRKGPPLMTPRWSLGMESSRRRLCITIISHL